MTDAGVPGRRTRITSAAGGPGPHSDPFPVSRDVEEQTEVGDIFVTSLIRSQLRLALVVAGGFLLLLAGVPLLSALLPALGSVTVFGMPLSWLLLGFGIYPVMIGAAWLFIRSATRNEDRYRALVEDQP